MRREGTDEISIRCLTTKIHTKTKKAVKLQLYRQELLKDGEACRVQSTMRTDRRCA